jgi:tetratricopeptide (TPR) repeat protein
MQPAMRVIALILLFFVTAAAGYCGGSPECVQAQETRLILAYVITGTSNPDAVPNEADLLGQAKQLYLAGKLHAANAIYSRLLQSDSQHGEALRGRGLVYLRLGLFDEAIRDLSVAEAQLGPYREGKFPGIVGSTGYLEWLKAQKIYDQGNEFLENKDYENAIRKYGQALHIYRRYPQCLHNLAIALGKSGQYHAAEMVCMEAISLRYSDWKFWKTLSNELYMQNKFHVALAAVKEAMHLGPPETEQAELIEDLEIVKDQLRKRHGFFS